MTRLVKLTMVSAPYKRFAVNPAFVVSASPTYDARNTNLMLSLSGEVIEVCGKYDDVVYALNEREDLEEDKR